MAVYHLHCTYCGADNAVQPDVIGKLCERCGKAIFSPEFEKELKSSPKALKATADRTGDVLRVTCPPIQE